MSAGKPADDTNGETVPIWNRFRPVGEVSVACVVCGEAFAYRPKPGAGRRRRFCSDDCRAARRNALQAERRELAAGDAMPRERSQTRHMIECTCLHCGTQFEAIYRTKRPRYCSNTCATAAHREQDRRRDQDANLHDEPQGELHV